MSMYKIFKKRADELSDTAIAAEAIPPGLAVAIKNCPFRSSDLKVGASDLDEWVICVEVFPESRTLERYLGAGLQFRKVNGRVSRNSDTIQQDVSAGCYSGRNARVCCYMAWIRG